MWGTAWGSLQIGGRMRKLLVVVGVVAGLAIPVAGLAANLNPGQVGQGCSGDGTYHFVAPGGSGSSRLTVDFSGTGDIVSPGVAPDKVTGGNAQWFVEGSGTILGASATNADRLVLSDFECDGKKDKK